MREAGVSVLNGSCDVGNIDASARQHVIKAVKRARKTHARRQRVHARAELLEVRVAHGIGRTNAFVGLELEQTVDEIQTRSLHPNGKH